MIDLCSADGTPLATEDREVASPRGRIVLVHGYAEHAGRYEHVIDRLMMSGFACHLFDLRGHGHSGGIRGHVARFSNYVGDLRLVVERARSRSQGSTPLIVLAHSLGGLIALELCRAAPTLIDSLALSSPFLRRAFDISAAKKLLAWGASHFAPTLRFANTLNPEWLSADSEVVSAYVNDPLVQRTTTPRWFTEVEEAQAVIVEHATEITLPLLMLLGGEDEIADRNHSENVFRSFGSPDKSLKVYPGLRHEIFNELRREEVLADLVVWLHQQS